ncbi:UTRA domain-containing protein [Streptomyces sp. NPDC059556]|uniref:UTRA domain-containing protein n=1 Tax=Streptomyces sp. NPDC059556 TaxID=3346863 RepID=UPI00368BFE18
MPSNSIDSTGTILRDARTRYITGQREEGGAHGAFDAELRRSGRTPRTEVEVSRGAAPADVAELLGVGGDDAVVRTRTMYDGDRVIQLVTTYIPVDVAQAAGIEQVDTGVGGIISRMKDAGYDQGETAIEDIELRTATSSESSRLGLPEGAEVLTINHIGTADGRVVEVTQHVLGKGWKLRYAAPLA